MTERYLIINADDFGLCRETNDAIEELFNEGRITSTTLMAPAKEAADAVSRAKSNSKISMGLHITLNSDFEGERWQSVAPMNDVRSLVDENGAFHHELRLFYSNAKENEVAAELQAQYDFAASSGVCPTHADSHCGTLYGFNGRPFLKEAFGLCEKYRIPFRFPRSKGFLTRIFGGYVPPEAEALHTNAVLIADSHGIHLPDDLLTNPFPIAKIPSFLHLKEFYLQAVRNIGEGVTELFLHPSHDSARMSAITPEWRKRVWEYRFLMEDDLMKTLERENIRLVSWANAPFKSVGNR